MINRDFDSAESGKFPLKTKKTHRTENAIWETRVLMVSPLQAATQTGKSIHSHGLTVYHTRIALICCQIFRVEFAPLL
jgi:hypothetical protein